MIQLAIGKITVEGIRSDRILPLESGLRILSKQDVDTKMEFVKGWKSRDASTYARKLIENLGHPVIVAQDMLAWNDQGGFTKVWIIDESLMHNFPDNHMDYVYSTRDIKVPASKVGDLAQVSGSIIIDQLKGEVQARCGLLIKNAVTLGFVEDFVRGEIEATKPEYARRIRLNIVPTWFKDPLGEIDSDREDNYPEAIYMEGQHDYLMRGVENEIDSAAKIASMMPAVEPEGMKAKEPDNPEIMEARNAAYSGRDHKHTMAISPSTGNGTTLMTLNDHPAHEHKIVHWKVMPAGEPPHVHDFSPSAKWVQ